MRFACPILVLALVAAGPRVFVATGAAQQAPSTAEPLQRPFDQLLDLYVRDGMVYYGALKADRARLDRYLASLDGPAVAGYATWGREQQIALWLNAYNAFVLRTVIDYYPIHARSTAYPSRSIRQIPGAFDRITRRVAGRAVTLDAIEKTILPPFRDPRLYLALGRGAVGSGRLHSEAYTAAKLDAQLTEVAREFVSRPELIRIDRLTNRIAVTPIIGWHEAEFIAAYPDDPQQFLGRSPVERALLSFVSPNLLPAEVEFVKKNEFTFVYQDFDWHLNDLAGRG
jgi:hypothetical protein